MWMDLEAEEEDEEGEEGRGRKKEEEEEGEGEDADTDLSGFIVGNSSVEYHSNDETGECGFLSHFLYLSLLILSFFLSSSLCSVVSCTNA